MKVGVNARTFTVDEPGGAVQTSIKHTRGLIELPDTDVILFGHDSLEPQFPDASVVSSGYIVDSQVYGLLWERLALNTLADKHDIDVLYCPNGNAPAVEPSCPVVMCIHDVNAQKGWSSGVHQLYRKIAIPRSATVADRIVTVSEFSKREIVDHLDFPSSKINVVYNGVDSLFFSEKRTELDGLPDDYLLFVGSMNPRKNISVVVESFAQLKDQTDVPHELVIVGPNNKNIFKNVFVDEQDDIVTPGFVTMPELKYAYENADVFVYPSLYEGFGLPPLEALACGTPVVTSNTTSLGEIVTEGSIQVDPQRVGDITAAIKTILDDDKFGNELVEAGRTHAQKFTWQRATEQLKVILSEVGQ